MEESGRVRDGKVLGGSLSVQSVRNVSEQLVCQDWKPIDL